MTKPKGKNTASRGSGEAEKVNNPSSLQEAEGDEEYVSLTMLKQMLSVKESIRGTQRQFPEKYLFGRRFEI